MEERLERPRGRAGLPRSGDAEHCDVGELGALDDLGAPAERLRREALGVHAQAFAQRQGGSTGVVAQDRARRRLRRASRLARLRCAHEPRGRVDVDERGVEEAEPHLLAQHAAGGGVDALLGDAALGHEVEEHVDRVLAAELVDAGIEGSEHPVLVGEVLDPHGVRVRIPQSLHTIPSKPSRSRSSPVTISRLKEKPTSSSPMPTGTP